MTITELIKGYKEKQFSPVEVATEYVKRIKKSQKKLNAFITITEDVALYQAEMAERKLQYNDDFGILHGVPFCYKDLIDVKGVRTTSGSLIDRDLVAKRNANVVKTLNKEGAMNLGKTNLDEYAISVTSNNPHYGSVKNPWDTRLIPGGSSGGSAVAVAANLSLGSIGTDTGGSIRIPAACCGVVGLKPTFGLVDVTGIMPASESLDHAGPITQNISDLSIVMKALTGIDYVKYCVNDVKGLRIGVPTNFIQGLDAEVSRLFDHAINKLEEMGAIIMEVDMSFAYETLDVTFTIAPAEAGYAHKSRMEASMDMYGDDVKAVLDGSHSIMFLAYREAMKKKQIFTQQVTDLFDIVDILVTPTLPTTPPEIDLNNFEVAGKMDSVYNHLSRFTRLFNITGHPALSIPCGITKDSLPVGLQMIGNQNREDKLIQASYSFEQEHLADFYEERKNICQTIEP